MLDFGLKDVKLSTPSDNQCLNKADWGDWHFKLGEYF